MLYVTRKPGEAIMIGPKIQLTILEIKGKTVKLGFSQSTPSILRKEIFQRIQQENQRTLASLAYDTKKRSIQQ